MRTLLSILIALSSLLYSCASQPRFAYAGKPNRGDKDLVQSYDFFNKTYFENKLPKNVIVEYKPERETNGYIAYTQDPFADGVLHIRFSEKYRGGTRITDLFMLHEMCHVKVWPEVDLGTGGHGPAWRACMLDLEKRHAFSVLLIDYITDEELRK